MDSRKIMRGPAPKKLCLSPYTERGKGDGTRVVFHAAHSSHDSGEEDAAICIFFFVHIYLVGSAAPNWQMTTLQYQAKTSIIFRSDKLFI